jgi:hypothetical protein
MTSKVRYAIVGCRSVPGNRYFRDIDFLDGYGASYI